MIVVFAAAGITFNLVAARFFAALRHEKEIPL
jgi:hypothetical protein